MPNPTTKLASFLFKERGPSQPYLELSSSRKCLAAGKVQERKRKKREKRENKVVKFCFETRARSVGCMAKAFETRCPKPSLVGSHRFCVRYMGG